MGRDLFPTGHHVSLTQGSLSSPSGETRISYAGTAFSMRDPHLLCGVRCCQAGHRIFHAGAAFSMRDSHFLCEIRRLAPEAGEYSASTPVSWGTTPPGSSKLLKEDFASVIGSWGNTPPASQGAGEPLRQHPRELGNHSTSLPLGRPW